MLIDDDTSCAILRRRELQGNRGPILSGSQHILEEALPQLDPTRHSSFANLGETAAVSRPTQVRLVRVLRIAKFARHSEAPGCNHVSAVQAVILTSYIRHELLKAENMAGAQCGCRESC